jgi:hypothetical protein
MQVYRLRGAIALTAIMAAAACSDNLSVAKPATFYANLSSDQEVPAVSVPGAIGNAQLTLVGPATGTSPTNAPGDSIHYVITFSGLSSNATLSHIHVGAGTVAGTVRVNLCGTGAPAAACPAATSGTITGTAAIITGTGSITFDSLYSALKSGGAYVNIHTVNNGGGEIRGVINKTPLVTGP